jgi:DNA-binding CsgD family transcriptional regulator
MVRATLKFGPSSGQEREWPDDAPGGGGSGGDTSRDEQALRSALDPALDAIALPAFVLTRRGRILRANALGRALLAREQDALCRSLGVALTARERDPAWDLMPLGVAECSPPVGYLALRRPPSREIPIAEALRIASRRWKLTARQREVLDLAARGLTNDLIAETLCIGTSTVEFHLSAIFDKAGVCNRASLIVRMYEVV